MNLSQTAVRRCTHLLLLLVTASLAVITSAGSGPYGAVRAQLPDDGLATLTTVTASSPSPSAVGRPVTINFSVEPMVPDSGTPTGTVTVSDGVTALCSASVAAGQCSYTFVLVGTKSLTAKYEGDATFAASTSAPVEHSVFSPAPITVTNLRSSPNPSRPGDFVTFTATVEATEQGGVPPQVLITAFGFGEFCTLPVGEDVSCSMRFVTHGTKHVSATVPPGTTLYYIANPPVSVTHQVLVPTETQILSTNPRPSTPGEPVFVTVAVTAADGSTPTGTMQVVTQFGEPVETCSATLVDGLGVCSMTFSTGRVLIASYAGDPDRFSPSDSQNFFHPVSNGTRLKLMPQPSPSTAGQAVSLKWTGEDLTGQHTMHVGNLTVYEVGGKPLCSVNFVGGGIGFEGSCDYVFSSAGTRSLYAVFLANGGPYYSPLVEHTVLMPTAVSAVSQPAITRVGESTTVAVTVTATPSSEVVDSGTVEISFSGDSATCTAAIANGQGTCDVTLTTMGVKLIHASYSGVPGTFAPSGNGGHVSTHFVYNPATTITIITDDPDPADRFNPVTFHVTVEAVGPASPGSLTPTGTVLVRDGSQSCVVVLVNGTGSCTIVCPTSGSWAVEGTYSGDATYDGSTNGVVLEPTSVRAITPTGISRVGEAVPVSVTVTADPPGSHAPNGTVAISISGDPATCVATVTNGQGTCSLTFTTTGNKQINAVYGGEPSKFMADSNFDNVSTHFVYDPATATTVISDSPDPSDPGEPVTINVSVAAVGRASPVSPTPSGTVTVSDGTQSCVATLTDGIGFCAIALSTGGARQLVATYAGDATYTSSTSVAAGHTVRDADNDGVRDADDICPNTAPGALVTDRGCSESQSGVSRPAQCTGVYTRLIIGTAGGDVLSATGDAAAVIYGLDGSDVIFGSNTGDCIVAGEGKDTIEGLGGDDVILGEGGVDNISGGEGNDSIFGDDGKDILSGDAGDDQITGGAGSDIGDGGDGIDACLTETKQLCES